jgi:hypothetical protein
VTTRRKLYPLRPPFVRRDSRKSQYCGFSPTQTFYLVSTETAAFAGGITMQAFNRIQNATINAIVGFQAGLVVDSANAHRAYPSMTTCEMYPVPKCPDSMPISSGAVSLMRSLKRQRLALKVRGSLVNHLRAVLWQGKRHNDQMPSTRCSTPGLITARCG